MPRPTFDDIERAADFLRCQRCSARASLSTLTESDTPPRHCGDVMVLARHGVAHATVDQFQGEQ